MATTASRARFDDVDSVGLLERVRAGDQDAYGELYVRYHDFAHTVARRTSRRHADDLVAEAFRRVLTAISRGHGPRDAFGPYLATTIRSVAAGYAAPYQEVELDVSANLLDDATEVDPRVATAYSTLPESWQNALWYADVEGLSPRHAAPLMGLPSSNAFSALRKRAHAGLRSAYLTLVVDDACNDEVREHLRLLIAGDATPEAVDRVVDEHLDSCDTCAAIAWRIAAVTGRSMPVALAPAVVAVMGFTGGSAVLPAGLGTTGLLGWIRRNSQAAATGVAVAAVAVAAVGIAAVAGNRTDPVVDEPPASVADEPAAEPEPTTAPTTTTTSTSTTSTSTTSTSTTSTTTTTEPLPSLPAPILPPSTTEPLPSLPPPVTIASTVPPTTTTPAVTTTTAPPTTTTTPATTSTTTPPTTTSTTTTTSSTTTSTTSTTSTTTTSSTTVPVTPPGDAVVDSDVPIGSGGGAKRDVVLRVTNLTGAPGTFVFSSVVEQVFSADDAVCVVGSATCDVNPAGAVAPSEVLVDVRFDTHAPITVELRDSSGAVVWSYTSP